MDGGRWSVERGDGTLRGSMIRRLPRRGRISAAVLASSCAFLVLACGMAFAAGNPLQRVGIAGAPATAPRLEAVKVKLGTATRNAMQVPTEFAFSVPLAGGWRQLTFSIGIAAVDAGSDRVEFAVDAGKAGQWRRVFSQIVSADVAGWANHIVRLDAPGAADESLQFSTIRRSAARGDDVRAFWGSVLIEPAAAAPSAEPEVGTRRPPNVILISLDTLGAKHVGWYGREPSVSPNLDALLGRSFAFRRAFAQYPNTLVSHASLFSGLYPNRHHVYGHPATLRKLTLAEILADHGYMTVGVTEDAYVSSDFGFDRGFDWYDDGQHVIEQFPGTARETFDKATEWLRKFGEQKPFFLFVHTYEVHTPYVPRDETARATLERLNPGYAGPFRELYPGGELEVKHNRGLEPLGARDVERLVALHASEIEYVDRIFGAFIDTVSRGSYADDTLIVVTADHGDEFNEHGKIGHGETLHNPVLHVPLAFYWPREVRVAAEDTRVQLVDVTPTVLDLIGLPVPPGLDGQTLAPAMRGVAGASIARPVFAELRSAWASCRELELPDDCRSEHYTAQTERFKYLTSMIPYKEELYDLQADPGETRDVAAEFPEELRRFRALLADYVIHEAPEPDFLAPTGERITVGSEVSPGLDDATRERLKALGYNP